MLRGARGGLRLPGFGRLLRVFLQRSRAATRRRIGGRRLGQAFVLARELDPAIAPHPCALSAHARLGGALCGAADRPELQLLRPRQGHLDDAGLGKAREDRRQPVGRDLHAPRPRRACARWRRRRDPDRVSLVYHGLDLTRFPAPPDEPSGRDGVDARRARRDRLRRPRRGQEGLRRPPRRARAACRPTSTGASIHIGSGELRGSAASAGGSRSASPTASTGAAACRRTTSSPPCARRRPLRAALQGGRQGRSRRAAQRHHGGGDAGACPSSRRALPACRNSSATASRGCWSPPGDVDALAGGARGADPRRRRARRLGAAALRARARPPSPSRPASPR